MSATFAGETLWIDLPTSIATTASSNALLSGLLFKAMALGLPVHLPGPTPVSEQLLAGLSRLQPIFAAWARGLTPVAVTADAVDVPSAGHPRVGQNGVASFFSGGVDGLYTLLQHREEISHLIYINGFDFLVNPSTFAANVARLERVATRFGKTVIPVGTNHFDVMRRACISRRLNHGSCLAAVALALGFERTYIPATFSLRDHLPFGSHPLTDPLWSTETTEIIHDGAEAPRSAKSVTVFADPDSTLDTVVCWVSASHNCGRCAKCERTMVALAILDIDSPAFPRHLSAEDIARLRPLDRVDRLYFEDNLELARMHGRTDIADALAHGLRVHAIKSGLIDLDKAMFDGRAMRAYRFVQRTPAPPPPEYPILYSLD